jgi:hypothetical protein
VIVVDRFSSKPSPPFFPPWPGNGVDLSPRQRLGLQFEEELPPSFPSKCPLVVAALRVAGIEPEAVCLPSM